MAAKKTGTGEPPTADGPAEPVVEAAGAVESTPASVAPAAMTAAPALPAPKAPSPKTAFTAASTAAAEHFETTTTKVKENMDKAMKTAEDLVTFGQGNFEAVVKSSQIWVAGVQDLSKQMAATAQAQVDQTMATLKALAGVKSLKEAIELHSTAARATVEKAVAETGKLTDASIKLAEQAMAPIAARLTLAAERFGRTA